MRFDHSQTLQVYDSYFVSNCSVGTVNYLTIYTMTLTMAHMDINVHSILSKGPWKVQTMAGQDRIVHGVL